MENNSLQGIESYTLVGYPRRLLLYVEIIFFIFELVITIFIVSIYMSSLILSKSFKSNK